MTKDDGAEQEEEFIYTHFTYKARWFVLAQTEAHGASTTNLLPQEY